MPMYCAAVNCSSKSDSTISSFFRFPKDTYRLVALIKYLYRMLYWCQVFSPVFCQCEASCHLPACVLRIPVPLPFPSPSFPSPLGWYKMRGGAELRGGTEHMYKTRVCGTHFTDFLHYTKDTRDR